MKIEFFDNLCWNLHVNCIAFGFLDRVPAKHAYFSVQKSDFKSTEIHWEKSMVRVLSRPTVKTILGNNIDSTTCV